MINGIKRIRITVAACLGAFFFLVLPTAVSASEQIRLFDVNIEVYKDGTFVVTETIEYDFGTAMRHGIYRAVPTDHPQKDRAFLLDRYLTITVEHVSMDGGAVPYIEEQDRRELYLRIGDPDITISGPHTYRIAYRVFGGLAYYDDEVTELYWNAIAPEWNIPIQRARVTLSDPDGVFTDTYSCYEGGVGAQTVCSAKITEDGAKAFSVSGLRPYEGVTIAQELNSTEVEQNILERKRLVYFWIPILIMWFSILSVLVYRHRTEYKIDKTIIAQYEPYADFKPMYTGLLFDGRLDPRDITAGIIYLAEQGYLKIKKIDTKFLLIFDVSDYEIMLLKPYALLESAFQRELLRLLFGPFPKEGHTVRLDELKKDVHKQKENKKILRDLKKDLEKDLEDAGFFQVHVSRAKVVTGVVVLGILLWIFGGPMLAFLNLHTIFVLVGIVGSIAIILFAYRRRTTKGYEALWHLKGFKEFLKVTEKDRYTFHNAPEKSPAQFMEFLPYAIAFGVEKEWAETFKDITIPDPEWYDGPGTHFSAVSFANSIDSFSTSLASSSGSSASSGGGSVGGGGGGGGGGSW